MSEIKSQNTKLIENQIKMEQTLKGLSQPARIMIKRETVLIDTTGPTRARDDNSDGCPEAYYEQPVDHKPAIQ